MNLNNGKLNIYKKKMKLKDLKYMKQKQQR